MAAGPKGNNRKGWLLTLKETAGGSATGPTGNNKRAGYWTLRKQPEGWLLGLKEIEMGWPLDKKETKAILSQ